MATEKQDTTRREPRRQPGGQERRQRIAEAAYYNAERRGFQPDGEVDDWLKAERQIDSLAGKGGAREEASAQQPDAAEMESQSDKALPPADAQKARRSDGLERPDFPDLDDTGVQHIEPDQVKQWAKNLDVSATRLREAIRRVGPVVEDVKRFLQGRES